MKVELCAVLNHDSVALALMNNTASADPDRETNEQRVGVITNSNVDSMVFNHMQVCIISNNLLLFFRNGCVRILQNI